MAQNLYLSEILPIVMAQEACIDLYININSHTLEGAASFQCK